MCARAAGPSPPPCRAHENARNLACCRRTTHPGHEQSSHPPGQQTVPGSVSREPEQVVLVIKDRARQPDTGQSESRGVTERLAYLSAATHVARAAAVALPSIATPSRSSPYCWEARRALVRPAPRSYPRPDGAAASAPVLYSGAHAAHDDQSAGREANRYNARHGTLTSACIGKSQSKLGVCGVAGEAGEAAGPPRIVDPEFSEPR